MRTDRDPLLGEEPQADVEEWKRRVVLVRSDPEEPQGYSGSYRVGTIRACVAPDP